MLKVVEYTLLAASLLVVLGLIVSGSHNTTDSSGNRPPDGSKAQEPGKTL
jgi:hypothetical protein